jgi:hypothetical protein
MPEYKVYVMNSQLGNVMLTPTDEGHMHVSTDAQIADASAIKVNNVMYNISAHIYLWPNGRWKFGSPKNPSEAWREPYMSRVGWVTMMQNRKSYEPTIGAKQKAREVLESEINAWVEGHPEAMAEAVKTDVKYKLMKARAEVAEKQAELLKAVQECESLEAQHRYGDGG